MDPNEKTPDQQGDGAFSGVPPTENQAPQTPVTPEQSPVQEPTVSQPTEGQAEPAASPTQPGGVSTPTVDNSGFTESVTSPESTPTDNTTTPVTEGSTESQSEIPSEPVASPPAQTGQPVTGAATGGPLSAGGSGKKKKLTFIAIIVAAVVLLLGGAAAAYYQFAVVNNPENVLKQALANTMQKRQISTKGSFEMEDMSEDSAVKNVIVDFSSQGDFDQKTSAAQFNLAMAGVSFPLEYRYVGESMYIKVGDLGSIKGAAGLANPMYGAMIGAVGDQLSDQWIEIDKSLLKEAGMDCYLNTSLSVTEEDVKLLADAYTDNKFATVTNTTSEDLDGRAVYKYEIDLDDNTMTEYFKNVEGLSFVKAIEECDEESTESFDTEELADDDVTPITLWVDKSSKLITKVASHSTQQDLEKENFKGNLEVTLSYDDVQPIEKPADAKPFMEVMGQLQAVLYSQMMAGEDYGSGGFSPETLGVFDLQ